MVRHILAQIIGAFISYWSNFYPIPATFQRENLTPSANGCLQDSLLGQQFYDYVKARHDILITN